MKVALALIVKGVDEEAPLLEQCLKSVSKHIDGIFITLTHAKGEQISNKVRKVAEKYTQPQNIYVYEWRDNFAHARNFSFSKVPKSYEFILWLDSDDTVANPEKIKETAEVVPKSVSGVYVCYDYAHDEYGNVTVPHYVARLVRNNGAYKWQSSFDDSDFAVHETLVETRSSGKRISEEWKVIHHADPTRSYQSLYRNIDLLDKMYKNQQKKGRLDPRILFYLGTHLFDAGDFQEAKRLLQDYMQLSGWANERSEALVYLGLIYAMEGKKGQAEHAYVLAIKESPNNPRPYTEIAQLELDDKREESASEWALKAIECKKRQTAMALRPMDATFRPYMIYAKALLVMGGTRLEKAMEYTEKALKMRPLDPEAQTQRDLIEELIEVRDLNRAFAKLTRALDGDKVKTQVLLQAVPEKLSDSPVVAQVRHETVPSLKWPRKSLVIWCGASVIETWGPSSLAKGVGGSEEAVIRLKDEFEKRGWQVHVYGTPGDDKDDTWHNYWEFNPKDEFDTLVVWRAPWFFDVEVKARKKYLWLHDVMPVAEFTPERLANLDKVIVLSEYHRSLFPNIPDDKIFLSANGITPVEFNIVRPARNPHRVIWMSSHVRGLELMYDIWPEVKKAVPDAKLDIYYGWESFINVQRNNPERMQWMNYMQQKEKELDGVTDHGKIGQAQIVEEIFKSGIWAYPCPFPEIYCITAIKAQAGGAIPVSSNFAALDETVQYGIKIPMKQQTEEIPAGRWDKKDIETYKKALIEMLKDPAEQDRIRPSMMKWARAQSWAKVATQWDKEMS